MKTASVIIPTYNRAERLERTLASVVGQDYHTLEIIVVDDGSTDDTPMVVNKFAEQLDNIQITLRYFRQENMGACVARNRGMMMATGAYLMFLDSDDVISPTKIGVQVHQLEREGSQCSICDYVRIDDSGTIISRHVNNLHPHEYIKRFLSPHVSTVLMRKDSIPPGLCWNHKLKRLQDIDFVFKYFATVETWSHVAQPLFHYCIHDDERISDSYSEGAQYKVLRDSFSAYVESSHAFVKTSHRDLINAYQLAVIRQHLQDVASKYVPDVIKRSVRMLLRIIGRYM